MKRIFFVVVLSISVFGFAQDAPKMPKYNAKNAAGIFYYNVLEATEKIKVKKEDKKASFSKELRAYNSKIKEISFLNMPKLNGTDLTVNSIGEMAFRDADLAEKVRKAITDNVLPVRDSVLKSETKLNENLKKILSKKQYKKWEKYQRAKKRELLPEAPKNNQMMNNNNSMMNSRRRMNNMGGLGGRRF